MFAPPPLPYCFQIYSKVIPKDVFYGVSNWGFFFFFRTFKYLQEIHNFHNTVSISNKLLIFYIQSQTN